VNKTELVAEVAKRTDRGKAEVARVIDAAVEAIRDSVARGDRVALLGFGTFEKRRRNKRVARNPRQPDVTIAVPARDVPVFTPGREFREAVATRSRRSAAKGSTKSKSRSTASSRSGTSTRGKGARPR
jgi:DNA-binding protein HU-beta